MTTSSDEVQLIVVADDFGLAAPVNRGVVRLCTGGALKETSLLANGDAFDDAVAGARATPDLGVGVHLNLVEGEPLCGAKRVPSLCGQDGRFLGGYTAFFRRYATGGVEMAEVEAELSAQVSRVLDAGIAPTHVNGHQHLHLVPAIARIAADLCRRHDIRSVRAPRPQSAMSHLASGSLKAALLASYAAPARRIFFSAGLYTPDDFFGMEIGGRLDVPYLEALCVRLSRRRRSWKQNSAVELMCHPAEGPFSHYPGYHPDQELNALLDPRIAEAQRSAGVAVVSFDEARRTNHARM